MQGTRKTAVPADYCSIDYIQFTYSLQQCLHVMGAVGARQMQQSPELDL